MTEQAYWLFAFDSPHAAIAAQKLLLPCGAAVMPTLRSITASCGMSVRLSEQQIERAKAMMLASSIDPSLYQLYYVEQAGAETRCTKSAME